MNYFDFHCHLDAPQLDETREKILVAMKDQNIGCNTIGVDLESSKRAVAFAVANKNIWATIGQHPLDNASEIFKATDYQKLIDEHKQLVVAVGECGLDYYWPQKKVDDDVMTNKELIVEKQRQKLLFQKNITLAIANNLPLMLHVRSSENTTDAHIDALQILASYNTEQLPQVVFHFYTEGVELAKQIIDAGYYISFPGVITFGKKVHELELAVLATPMDKIFAETDSPYAAPKPYRGRTNNPVYVQHVYEKIAEIKQMSIEEVQIKIRSNIKDFLSLDI